MTSSKFLQLLFLGLILTVISGCAYPISKNLRAAANPDLTLPMVVQNAKPYLGSIAIWGGIIFEVMNPPEGTEITIIQTPLGSDGYANLRIPQGQFIAKTDKHLNPEIYRKGKKITLAGVITGVREKELRFMKIPYPEIKIMQLHLWEDKDGEVFPLTLTKEWELEVYVSPSSPSEGKLDDLPGTEW